MGGRDDPPPTWGTMTLPCPTDMVPVMGQDFGDPGRGGGRKINLQGHR